MMMIDAAWLAGIVEGEGCIDQPRGRARLRVKMTDLDVVTRVAALMGSTVYTDDWNARHYGHKVSYVAQVTGEKAVAILRELQPMLGARRAAKAGAILSAHLDAEIHRALSAVA